MSSKRLPLLVLSGTHAEFIAWKRQVMGPDARNAVTARTEEEVLKGEYSRVMTLGTFFEKPGASELYGVALGRVR